MTDKSPPALKMPRRDADDPPRRLVRLEGGDQPALSLAGALKEAGLTSFLGEPVDLPALEIGETVRLARQTRGLTQQALAEKLLVGRSAMSMLLPVLERRGLIERRSDEADRRLRRLWLTPAGEALTRKAMAIHVAEIEAMMTVLSDEECNAAGEAMRRVAKALEARSTTR